MEKKSYINSRRKPEWLKIQLPKGKHYAKIRDIVDKHQLHTICVSGKCPNMGECWDAGTATFMILGEICTRSCRFCNTKTGRPLPLNPQEPENLADSIRLMNLKHAVVTSVDRDDLPDLGAAQWTACIRKVKEMNPETTMEVLIPDFQGREELVQEVIEAQPEIISHNMETVKRLSSQVRSAAYYDVSLQVLKQIAQSSVVAKSGIMVGLGETDEEIYETMDDLLAVGVEVLTIGQYLQPTRNHLEVSRYVTPEEFKHYETVGLEKGLRIVESGPLVRSSYHAQKHV